MLRRESFIPYFSLALYYVITMNTNLFAFYNGTFKFLADTTKIRRVGEYGAIPPEQADCEDQRSSPLILSNRWLTKGGIVFDNVSFGYDRVNVLRNIDQCITPGAKIGLVGRTGSGKSSLLLALFRIHELASGCIPIDGVDISLLDLPTLRSRLAIDLPLWDVLRKTKLARVVSRLNGKLSFEQLENAENLSRGECQSLCLSRMLLRQPTIVMLDEATTAVHSLANEMPQLVLRTELSHSTVITVSQRLDAVLQADRVLVMDSGRIVQSGTVDELGADANGPFFDLFEATVLNNVICFSLENIP